VIFYFFYSETIPSNRSFPCPFSPCPTLKVGSLVSHFLFDLLLVAPAMAAKASPD